MIRSRDPKARKFKKVRRVLVEVPDTSIQGSGANEMIPISNNANSSPIFLLVPFFAMALFLLVILCIVIINFGLCKGRQWRQRSTCSKEFGG